MRRITFLVYYEQLRFLRSCRIRSLKFAGDIISKDHTAALPSGPSICPFPVFVIFNLFLITIYAILVYFVHHLLSGLVHICYISPDLADSFVDSCLKLLYNERALRIIETKLRRFSIMTNHEKETAYGIF